MDAGSPAQRHKARRDRENSAAHVWATVVAEHVVCRWPIRQDGPDARAGCYSIGHLLLHRKPGPPSEAAAHQPGASTCKHSRTRNSRERRRLGRRASVRRRIGCSGCLPADFARALVTQTLASEQVVFLPRCQRVLRHHVEVKSSIAFDEEHAIRGGVAACCVSIVAARLHQV